jgi:protein TonB
MDSARTNPGYIRPDRDDSLGPGFRWSLIGHGAIALVILLKSLVFPSPPLLITPALRVDMVGLPDVLKKDLAKLSKAPPKEDLQQQLKEAAEQAKKVKPVELPKEAPAAKEEMVLNPKKAAPARETDAEREKRLKSALARIRAMERLKDKNEDAPKVDDDDAVIIRGNQISKGTSLSGEAKEQAEAGYYDTLRERLVEFWSLPPWLAQQKLAAQVMITIDSAGNILSTKFVRPSGNAQFDEAIRATLREAQPLPKPPAKIAGTVSSEGVLIGFPL